MKPAKVYEQMVAEITVHDLRKVARILTAHIGEANAIRLDALALMVYSDAGDSAQRKVREIIETLIEERGFPVCSHSGRAGRWLAETQTEANSAAAEREARAEKLRISATKLRQAGYRLPAGEPKWDDQPRLFKI